MAQRPSHAMAQRPSHAKARRPATTTARRSSTAKARRRGAQWIPNYHGAWAMIALPPLLGIYLGGFTPLHIALLALWWIGYFDFFAIGLWLRSRRKPRFRPPVIAYTVPCVILAAVIAYLAPFMWWWAVIFTPLVAITFWQSSQRADRSMLNDTVTVLAACLMLPVTVDLATLSHPQLTWQVTWTYTALVFGYFLGTVFYVKTNIRERNSFVWLAMSVAWHAGWTIVSIVLACGGSDDVVASPWHVALWVVLTIRAGAVPIWGARHGWFSARALGIGEVVTCLAFAATLLMSRS